MGRLQITSQTWHWEIRTRSSNVELPFSKECFSATIQCTATIQERVLASVLLARRVNRTLPMPCFNKRIDLLRMLRYCVVTVYWNSYPFILTDSLTSILRNNTGEEPKRK